MKNLAKKKCIACNKKTPLVSAENIQVYLDLMPNWNLVKNGRSIECMYVFKDFIQTMRFVGAVADIAEEEGHHPDLHISYNKLRIEIYTHAIDGLSENDFILASKIATLYEQIQGV